MKYFTIKELTASSTATAKGIDNTPTEDIINNLTMLVDKVLDPLREKWGGPIYVNSGYRCKELNDAVGGSKSSDHMTGRAADLTVKSKAKNKELYDMIKANFSFDQLIDESDMSWVHVSYRGDNENRHQELKL